MPLTFVLTNTDIDFEKRQEITSSIEETLYELAKTGAENIIKLDQCNHEDDQHYKNMSWQEVYCRQYDIQHICWQNDEDAKEFDWDFAVHDYCEEKAENALNNALKNIELQIHL